jgi:tRNA uridine 5-carboxymethylaminomethyl modification enzyme
VFLEPESLEDDWIYCNGISTSLPKDVQDVMVRSMPGCERAEIYRYGYAVEYDMVRPHQIAATGMTKLVHGLFLAGQINGTSGYEEAAGQGLIAGINAARLVRGSELITLGREQAYIGVLMDDLVTKTPVEPYRMFTSRAEHRLLLRADNAPERLTPLAMELGLLATTELGRRREAWFARRRAQADVINRQIDTIKVGSAFLKDLVKRPDYSVEQMRGALGDSEHCERTAFTVYTDRFYAPFISRQQIEVKRAADLERRQVPADFDYASIVSMRAEARAALAKFRPATLGQAGRLEGVTPSDVTLLCVLIERHRRERAGSA